MVAPLPAATPVPETPPLPADGFPPVAELPAAPPAPVPPAKLGASCPTASCTVQADETAINISRATATSVARKKLGHLAPADESRIEHVLCLSEKAVNVQTNGCEYAHASRLSRTPRRPYETASNYVHDWQPR